MSAQVKGCPQRDDTPERVRAYTPFQIAQMNRALAKAAVEADKIHVAWLAAQEDDES